MLFISVLSHLVLYDFGSYIIYRITRKYRFYWFYFISIFDKKICSERISPEEKTLANAWPDQLKLDKLDDSLLDEEDFYEEDYEDDDDLSDDDDDYYDDEEYYEDEYNDEDGKVIVSVTLSQGLSWELKHCCVGKQWIKEMPGAKIPLGSWKQQLEMRVREYFAWEFSNCCTIKTYLTFIPHTETISDCGSSGHQETLRHDQSYKTY